MTSGECSDRDGRTGTRGPGGGPCPPERKARNTPEVQLSDRQHGHRSLRPRVAGFDPVQLRLLLHGEPAPGGCRPAAVWIRRSRRTSAGEVAGRDPGWCGPSQYGQANSDGQRSGPPIELSWSDGAPGRGCSRVAVRARGVSCGNTIVMSAGRGGVLRVMVAPGGTRLQSGRCRWKRRGD